MENITCKMSARRSLAAFLGEPDHDQNKLDLARWNAHYDSLFAKKWGINPKTGSICDDSRLRWERVHEPVPVAYKMPSLSWACNPRTTESCKRAGGELNHLGLHGPKRPRTSLVTSAESPLRELDSSSLDNFVAGPARPTTPESFPSPAKLDSVTASSKPADRSQNPAEQTKSSSSSSSCLSSSSDTRQTTISEFFPQRKMLCAKRRILN